MTRIRIAITAITLALAGAAMPALADATRQEPVKRPTQKQIRAEGRTTPAPQPTPAPAAPAPAVPVPAPVPARQPAPAVPGVPAPARPVAVPAAPPPAARSEPPCTPATARPMSIAAITAAPAAAVGRCVTIEAIGVGRLLAADNAARYRQERVENDPSSNGALIGIYYEQSFREARRVRATGIVGDCTQAQGADDATATPETLLLQTGYCHYFKGLFLRATALEPGDPVRLSRIPRGSASAGLGNLSPLPAGDVRRRMLVAANAFLTALRAGDRDALRAMHGAGPGGARGDAEWQRVQQVLFSPRSAFASMFAAQPTAIELFGWRDPLWADADWRAERARTGGADAIACFSVRPDAAAQWPIDSKDADNLPIRPYACTRIHIQGTGLDAPASFDTEQAPGGLAEPQVAGP